MIYQASHDSLDIARNNLAISLNERVNAETAANTLNPSKERYLARTLGSVARLDSFTLSYFATHAPTFGECFLTHRRSNAMMNIYALSKHLVIARVLNGGVFDENDPNEETIVGVVLALAWGVNNGVRIAGALDNYMNREGKRGNYRSGATQSSSTLRSLEAFGIVKEGVREGTCKTWHIANAERFARLLDGAHGVYASAVYEHDNNVTLDSVCEEIAPLAALPAPMQMLAPPSDDTGSDDTGSDDTGDASEEAPAPVKNVKKRSSKRK